MPGRGPAPNPDDARVGHDRADAPDPVEVPAAGWLGEVPPMPDHPQADKGLSWHPWSVEWYDGWRDVPWAAHFGPTDWRFIAETLVIYDRYVRGDLKLASELRLRTSKLGYTIEDRQRLRLKLRPDAKPGSQEGPSAPPAGVPSLDDRRKRMGIG